MVQCQIEKTIVPWNPHQHKTYTYYKIMFWRRAKWRSWWMDGWSPMGPVEANGKHLQQKSKIVVCRTISCFLTLNETFLTCLIFLISLSVEFVGYTRNFVFSSLNYLWILPLIIISHSRFEQIKSELLLVKGIGAIYQNLILIEVMRVEFNNFDINP